MTTQKAASVAEVLGAPKKQQRYGSTKYVLLDTETTGLVAGQCSIIELGARELNDNFEEVGDEFHLEIRPIDGRFIHPKAIEVNGHTWASDPVERAKRPGPIDAWNTFYQWLVDRFGVHEVKWIVLVGWNISFDETMLKDWHELARKNDRLFRELNPDKPAYTDKPWPFHYHKIDLLGTARYLDAMSGVTRRSYKLEHLAQELFGGVSKFTMHTALGDCYMALMCVKEIQRRYDQRIRDRTREACEAAAIDRQIDNDREESCLAIDRDSDSASD